MALGPQRDDSGAESNHLDTPPPAHHKDLFQAIPQPPSDSPLVEVLGRWEVEVEVLGCLQVDLLGQNKFRLRFGGVRI